MDVVGALQDHGAMDKSQALTVIAVFFLAGGVKGVTGMGLPTVAVSLLGLWMAPIEAAALLVVPSLATNVAQCRGPHFRTLVSRLWPGWAAIAIVTVFAPGLGNSVPAESARTWLGAVLVGYGVWGLWRPRLPDLSTRGRWLGAGVGLATGAVTALTAVFVIPWVPYLQSLRLGTDEMVQALGLSFTVASVALAIRVQASLPGPGWSTSALLAIGVALVGSFAGMKAGELVRGRLAGATFQKALFLVFMALGVVNLLR